MEEIKFKLQWNNTGHSEFAYVGFFQLLVKYRTNGGYTAVVTGGGSSKREKFGYTSAKAAKVATVEMAMEEAQKIIDMLTEAAQS